MNRPGWTLVFLAAGRGRRFGGDKQLAPLGPSGELLSDYTLSDAIDAGAAHAVFVVRPDIEAALRTHHLPWTARVDIRYVVQPNPLGTTDALLAARNAVPGSFVVVNADDYYGREAIRAGADAVSAGSSHPPAGFVISFRLADTLSPRGGVSRALLEVDQHGWLQGIREMRDVTATTPLKPDQPISMNCWAFSPDIFPLLQNELHRFQSRQAPAVECALPDAIGSLIAQGLIRVKVIPAGSDWIGLTYAEDAPAVQGALRRLVEGGAYPTPLAS